MAWKTGGREDILRRRPPEFCKLVVWILMLTIVVQYVNGISCKINEVRRHNSYGGGYHCLKCPVCPPGQGLDRQCLNFKKLNANESLKCEICKTGTFSDKNDTATCQACQQCDGLKTLRNCTKTENTQCSKECKDGLKLEKVFGIQMCVPYTKKPRTTSQKPTTHLYTTGELPTTPNVDSAKNRPVPKSTQKSTTAIKDDEKTKTPSVNNQDQEGEKQKSNVFTIIISIFLICFTLFVVYGIKKREKIWRFICHLYCSCKRGSDQNLNETTPMNPDEQQELEEIVSVPKNQQREGVDPVSATSPHLQGEGQDPVSATSHLQGEGQDPVSATSHLQGEGQDPVSATSHLQGEGQDPVSATSPHLQGEGQDPVSATSHLQGEGQDPVSATSHLQGENLEKSKPVHHPVIPNLADQRLKDLSHTLRSKIALEISKKQLGLKGWREIGEMCKISKIELDGMETTSYYSCGCKVPGECLLESLDTSKPELTLVKFIEMLRSLERKDVILLIYEEISKISVTVS